MPWNVGYNSYGWHGSDSRLIYSYRFKLIDDASMSKQRHIRLESISQQLTAKLKRTAGAYRLGNISKREALTEAEDAFTKAFNDIMHYTKGVPVQRDLGKNAKPLDKTDINTLKQEITKKTVDFQAILDDLK